MRFDIGKKYTLKKFEKYYYRQYPYGSKDQMLYYWNSYNLLRKKQSNRGYNRW